MKTKSTSDYRPKFSFEITEEQQLRVFKVFSDYGQKKAIMSRILDEILDMVDQHGMIVFGVILDKNTQPREIIPSLNKAERICNGRS